MSIRPAIANHRGLEPRAAAKRPWITRLVADGGRSLASLGVDGWLAVLALVAGAIALAPFVEMAGVHEVDAGTMWQGLYLLACIRLFQVKGIGWPWWLLRRHSVLCGFLLIALLSTTWSEHPAVSLNRSLSLIGTTLVGVCIGQLLSQRVLMAAWMWGLALLVGVSLGVYLLAPELAAQLAIEDWDGRFRGFATGKNHAGKFLAFAAILFAAATIKAMIDRPLGLCLTAMYVVAAVLTESMTSLLALTAGTGAIAGVLVAKKLGWSVTTVIALAGMGTILLVGVAILYVDVFTEFIGKKATLSGRTLLWTATLDTIAHQPFLGYGYFAIWSRPETNELLNAFTDHDFRWSSVPHAHNGFFQVATDLGVPVAILTLAYVIGCLVQAIKAFYRDESAFSVFAVGFVTGFIVMNIGSLTLLRSRSGIWIVFVAITVALARSEAERQAAPREARTTAPAAPVAVPPVAIFPAAIPPVAAQLRERLRVALPGRQAGAEARSTALREQLERTLRERQDAQASRLEELRRQLQDAILPRHPPGLFRLAKLRQEFGLTMQRRHGESKGDGWSGWTGLRPHLKTALARRNDDLGEDRPATEKDEPSSSG